MRQLCPALLRRWRNCAPLECPSFARGFGVLVPQRRGSPVASLFQGVVSVPLFFAKHQREGVRIFLGDVAEPIRVCAELLSTQQQQHSGVRPQHTSPLQPPGSAPNAQATMLALLGDLLRVLRAAAPPHSKISAARVPTSRETTGPTDLQFRSLRPRELCRLAVYLVQYELMTSELLDLLCNRLIPTVPTIEQYDVSKALWALHVATAEQEWSAASSEEAVAALLHRLQVLSRACMHTEALALAAREAAAWAAHPLAAATTRIVANQYFYQLEADFSRSVRPVASGSAGAPGAAGAPRLVPLESLAHGLAKTLSAFSAAGMRALVVGGRVTAAARAPPRSLTAAMAIESEVAAACLRAVVLAVPHCSLLDLALVVRSVVTIGLFPAIAADTATSSAGVWAREGEFTRAGALHPPWERSFSAAVEKRAALLLPLANARSLAVFCTALELASRGSHLGPASAHHPSQLFPQYSPSSPVLPASSAPEQPWWAVEDTLPSGSNRHLTAAEDSAGLLGSLPVALPSLWPALLHALVRAAPALTLSEASHVLRVVVGSGLSSSPAGLQLLEALCLRLEKALAAASGSSAPPPVLLAIQPPAIQPPAALSVTPTIAAHVIDALGAAGLTASPRHAAILRRLVAAAGASLLSRTYCAGALLDLADTSYPHPAQLVADALASDKMAVLPPVGTAFLHEAATLLGYTARVLRDEDGAAPPTVSAAEGFAAADATAQDDQKSGAAAASLSRFRIALSVSAAILAAPESQLRACGDAVLWRTSCALGDVLNSWQELSTHADSLGNVRVSYQSGNSGGVFHSGSPSLHVGEAVGRVQLHLEERGAALPGATAAAMHPGLPERSPARRGRTVLETTRGLLRTFS